MDDLRRQLQALAEPGYAAFQQKLLPGVPGILGVRMGYLRKIAKARARGDWRALVNGLDGRRFEETMLHGLLLGYADMELAERLERLESFARTMGDWSVCDSTAITCKFVKNCPERALPWLLALANDPAEFAARFALVMMIDFFVEDAATAQTCLEAARAVAPGRYYVDMARAWLAAEVCVRHPAMAPPLMAQGWDSFTQHMAGRKIRESLRADGAIKAWARSL